MRIKFDKKQQNMPDLDFVMDNFSLISIISDFLSSRPCCFVNSRFDAKLNFLQGVVIGFLSEERENH
jgi:hypothetical protein